MKYVQLADLKMKLSKWVALAASGTKINVTKYGKPFVLLTAAMDPSVHVGENVGKMSLNPAISKNTKGAWRKILADDREE